MGTDISSLMALYIHQMQTLLTQFLQWGQWLFFSLLTLQLSWRGLQAAFSGQSLSDSLPPMLRELVVVGLFYTLMVHTDWLFQVISTVQTMGHHICQAPVDPSSLLSLGLSIGNHLLLPVAKTSLLSIPFSAILLLIVYVIVIYVFLKIALEVAVTLIVMTALVNLSAFFLAFSALSATRGIAQQTLDTLLSQAFRLLGIYVVIGCCYHSLLTLSQSFPVNLVSFDPTIWVAASVLLFYLLAEQLPAQLARLASSAMAEYRAASPATMVASMAQTSWQAKTAAFQLVESLKGVGKTSSAAVRAGLRGVSHLSPPADLSVSRQPTPPTTSTS